MRHAETPPNASGRAREPGVDHRKYFSAIRDDYLQAAQHSEELYQNTAAALAGVLRGTVVDFGNGGIINYDTGAIDKLACLDITNQGMHTTDARIDFLFGDFYDFELEFQPDVILAQFLFHHLNDDRRLFQAIQKTRQTLARGGELVVLEIDLPRFLEIVQHPLRPILERLFAALGKPAVRFFSARSLLAMLRQAGFRGLRVKEISVGRKVSPAPVLFPRLRISGGLYPFKCILIRAAA